MKFTGIMHSCSTPRVWVENVHMSRLFVCYLLENETKQWNQDGRVPTAAKCSWNSPTSPPRCILQGQNMACHTAVAAPCQPSSTHPLVLVLADGAAGHSCTHHTKHSESQGRMLSFAKTSTRKRHTPIVSMFWSMKSFLCDTLYAQHKHHSREHAGMRHEAGASARKPPYHLLPSPKFSRTVEPRSVLLHLQDKAQRAADVRVQATQNGTGPQQAHAGEAVETMRVFGTYCTSGDVIK